MIKRKNYKKDTSPIKSYTKEQVVSILKTEYNNFYSGKSCNISDWEFDTLLDMVKIDLSNSNEPSIIKEKSLVTKTGKLNEHPEKCPICFGNTIKINGYTYCNNATCSFWYELIFNRLLSFIDSEYKRLLRYNDFESLATVIDLNQIFDSIDKVSEIYNFDLSMIQVNNNGLSCLKYLELIRSNLIKLSINTDYFDMFSRHLRSYIENIKCKQKEIGDTND